MQYLITAFDGTDENALERRMAVRQAHVDLCNKLKREGKLLFGAAILDDAGKMIGSSLVGEFETRADLDEWLKIEPYLTGKVWEKVEIKQCKVGPTFLK